MRTLVCFLFFFSLPILSFSQWEKCKSPGKTGNFVLADFPQHGYTFAMHSKKIFRSNDFGLNWETLDFDFGSGFTSTRVRLDYARDTLFMIHGNLTLRFSTDDGLSWQNYSLNIPPEITYPNALYCTDNYAVVLASQALYRTPLSGSGVVEILDSTLVSNHDNQLKRVGNELWYNNDKKLFYSPDEGNTWELKYDCHEGIIDFDVQGDTVAFCSPIHVFTSTNTGATWNSTVLPYSSSKTNFYIAEGRFYYQSPDQDFIYSEDLGKTWNTFPAPLGVARWVSEVRDVLAHGDEILLTIHDFGCLKSVDDGQSWVLVNSGLEDEYSPGSLRIRPFTTADDMLFLDFGYFSPNGKDSWSLPVLAEGMPLLKDHLFFQNEYYALNVDGNLFKTLNGDLMNWRQLTNDASFSLFWEFSLWEANDVLYRFNTTNYTLARFDDLNQTWDVVWTAPTYVLFATHQDKLFYFDKELGLFESSDAVTWNPTGVGLTDFLDFGIYEVELISTDSFFYIKNSLDLSVSLNGGASFLKIFTPIDPTPPYPNIIISDIAVKDDTIVLLSQPPFGVLPRAFVSFGINSQWFDITSDLPEEAFWKGGEVGVSGDHIYFLGELNKNKLYRRLISTSNLVQIENPTSSQEDIAVQMYPNPSSGIFNFNLENAELQSLRVYRTDGQLLIEKVDEKEARFDLTTFPSGQYLVEFITSKGIGWGKVVKE